MQSANRPSVYKSFHTVSGETELPNGESKGAAELAGPTSWLRSKSSMTASNESARVTISRTKPPYRLYYLPGSPGTPPHQPRACQPCPGATSSSGYWEVTCQDEPDEVLPPFIIRPLLPVQWTRVSRHHEACAILTQTPGRSKRGLPSPGRPGLKPPKRVARGDDGAHLHRCSILTMALNSMRLFQREKASAPSDRVNQALTKDGKREDRFQIVSVSRSISSLSSLDIMQENVHV